MALVKGWTVDPAHMFTDEGISGTKTAADRPGLMALLQTVEQGAVAAVIVLALDRLGRTTRIVLDLVEAITAYDVELVSCKESLDTSTPAGRFVLTLFAALAQLERDTIVERTTGERNARGAQDGERGGRVPYGYRRVGEVVKIDPAAAAVVRKIDVLDRRKKLSQRAIAEALNAAGVPTPQGGAQWDGGTVRVILQNRPLYHGGQRGASAVCWPKIL
jgi:site-specific DNA recombinase